MRDFPKNKQGNGENRAKYSLATLVDRVTAPIGATLGTCGGENYLYAMASRKEKLSDVVTSMFKVFSMDVYALLDLGASLCFVTLYVVIRLSTFPEQLLKPLSVSKLIGELF
ncbi:hypothetical protein H5410_041497 [Solanum commersonii]|uniref:Uncharacterized protein n=1 Tax=Solanum commersonii TaxID=4109 RepID=A0A9J5XTS6_SOLCO|nr:hypothetical protein H5410_041497 [Solanum commersonii]